MKNKAAKILALSILLITFVYGVGEYLKWWDFLSGRTNALKCYGRFASNENYPKLLIRNNEPEFLSLIKFIRSKADVPQYDFMMSQGYQVTSVVRVGGTLGHEIQNQMAPEWPKVTFVPETSPIAFIYSKDGVESQKLNRICSLGDIRRWVDAGRENERFWMLTISVGVLSIALWLMESNKSI